MNVQELMTWLDECIANRCELLIVYDHLRELRADLVRLIPPPKREDPLITRLRNAGLGND